MAVEHNLTIVHTTDREASAHFLADILGLPPPRSFGPFLVVQTADGVSLDFIAEPGEISRQHHAFQCLKANSMRPSAEFKSAD
jgi:hypothetical protein